MLSGLAKARLNYAAISVHPWKTDWKRSWALLYLLPALLFMTGYALPETRLYALCALILSAMLGWRLRVRLKARRHGQAVEATFVSKAIPALARAGFHVEAGRMTQVGDIDLVVSRPGWAATIEIKSFRYWRGRLRDQTSTASPHPGSTATLGDRRGRCGDLAAKCPNQLARPSVELVAPRAQPICCAGVSTTNGYATRPNL